MLKNLEEKMKQEYKKYMVLAGWLFVLYLCIRYWDRFINIVFLGIQAASPLILGAVIAYMLNIIMSFFERHYLKKCKFSVVISQKRIICMLLSFVSLAGIIFLIFQLVLPELVNCIRELLKKGPAVIEEIYLSLKDNTNLAGYMEILDQNIVLDQVMLEEKIEQAIGMLLNGVGGMMNSVFLAVTSLVSWVVTLLVGMIFSIYLLLGKEQIGKQIKLLICTYLPKYDKKIFYVADTINHSFHNFIVGQCTEAVILGSLCIVGMWICRFPYAVMIGVLVGFTALIPIAGAYIGAGVGAFMIFTVSPVKAVFFLVFIVVLQQLEGNLIYPRVVGSSIGLPGIWVLAAITIGGGILGIGGMLVAVPLTAAVYQLLREDVYNRKKMTAAVSKEIKKKTELKKV